MKYCSPSWSRFNCKNHDIGKWNLCFLSVVRGRCVVIRINRPIDPLSMETQLQICYFGYLGSICPTNMMTKAKSAKTFLVMADDCFVVYNNIISVSEFIQGYCSPLCTINTPCYDALTLIRTQWLTTLSRFLSTIAYKEYRHIQISFSLCVE